MGFIERNAAFIITLLLALGIFFSLFFAELLGHRFGLGQVVVYEVNPLYGYRPAPNQSVTRHKATVELNHQGLRTDNSWETDNLNKVLFLGDSITYGGSYIDNNELFSYLSTRDIPEVVSANAGVNGWGVSNVAGLVVDYDFTPANIYISTFPEEDFIRGLNRMSGSPFWPHKPKYALSELWHYLLYKLSLRKFDKLDYPLNGAQWIKVKEKAVLDLKRMHQHLLEQGYQHLIFITPTKAQAKKLENIDTELQSLFIKEDLPVIYLNQEIELEEKNIDSLYHDAAHLSVEGHALWSKTYEAHIKTLL